MATGGYEYNFSSALPDRIVCKICQCPSRDPYLSVCCGHVFCKTCIDQVKRASLLNDACPVCRDEDFPTVPNKQIDREVKSLIISCTNKEKGCTWKGEIRSVEAHRKACQLEMVQCDYHNVGCKATMCRRDVKQHNKLKVEEHLALNTLKLNNLERLVYRLLINDIGGTTEDDNYWSMQLDSLAAITVSSEDQVCPLIGKLSNQSLNSKTEQTIRGGQGENDHEISDQLDANLNPHDQRANTKNANSKQNKIKANQDEDKTNQDKANSDQDEVKGPSTPPCTQSTSADNQATEIIDSKSSNNSQCDEGDDEDQATPDASSNKGNKQPSSDEEEQYDRPWYKFWSSNDTPGKKRKVVTITHRPSVWSARDTVTYRNGYPGKKDNKKIDKNLKFYRNEIPSYPHGDYIDVIHEKWWGDYEHLEYNHSYIHWLFPIREQGLNMYAEVLQLHEAEAICSDPVAHGRLVKSYKMMLEFYGIRLSDEKTGDLERADNWKERFHHLNHSMHNYLRITRILKCLGEMQLEHQRHHLYDMFCMRSSQSKHFTTV